MDNDVTINHLHVTFGKGLMLAAESSGALSERRDLQEM